MVGSVLFVSLLPSPRMLPADRPSHWYRKRIPRCFGCSMITSSGGSRMASSRGSGPPVGPPEGPGSGQGASKSWLGEGGRGGSPLEISWDRKDKLLRLWDSWEGKESRGELGARGPGTPKGSSPFCKRLIPPTLCISPGGVKSVLLGISLAGPFRQARADPGSSSKPSSLISSSMIARRRRRGREEKGWASSWDQLVRPRSALLAELQIS